MSEQSTAAARELVMRILQNCACHYVNPELYRPENPQEAIDMAMRNGVDIVLASRQSGAAPSTAPTIEIRGYYSREELCTELDTVTEERNELITEDTNLREVLASVLGCPGFWHGEGGILEAIAKLRATPAPPVAPTEPAEKFYLRDKEGDGRFDCMESWTLGMFKTACEFAEAFAASRQRAGQEGKRG